MKICADSSDDSDFDGCHREEETMASVASQSHLDFSQQPPTRRRASIRTCVRPTRAFVFALAILVIFTTQCCVFIIPLQIFPRCHALSSSMPSSSQRTLSSTSLGRRCNFCTPPQIHLQQHQYQHAFKLCSLRSPPLKFTTVYSFQLLSHSLSSDDEQPPNLEEQRPKPNAFPATTPFNHDIARTLFAPLFFSRAPLRPSPFEDPSCAQTADRMLRRMMENRNRSDGRTVCPDGRTFGLVAGAFGRLRCGSDGRRVGIKVDKKMVTWEEEPNTNPQYQIKTSHREDGQSISRIQMTPIDKLQQLLQLQLQLCHREGWPKEIRPSFDMYNRVLKRLAWRSASIRHQDRDNEVSAAEQAWLWLQFMKSPLPQVDGEDGESIICHPDAMSYSHVIGALSAYRAPVQSESGKINSNSLMDPPTVSAYESIEALAEQLDIEIESKRPRINHSPQWFLTEAEELLITLEDKYNRTAAGENNIEHGWNQDELKRALAHGYRCLLEGWGRYAVTMLNSDGSNPNYGSDDESGDNREHAIKRAHELLGRLESLLSTENQSEKALLPLSQTAVVPSSCYSSVILALSVSNLPSAANAAEDLLERMMAQYSIDQSSSFFNVAFSGCIAAHAKNNDAPRAEKILNKMIDLYDNGKMGSDFVPEVRAFGTCIALWAKYSPANVRTSSDKGSQRLNKRGKMELPSYGQRMLNADRAEAILSELEGVAEVEATKDNGNFVLHATPYNIAILARVQTIAGNSGSSSKNDKYKGYKSDKKQDNEQIILHAQSILDHMEYQMGVTPDPYTYSILLNAWCQQCRPGREGEKAADYAEELLRRRIEDVDIGKIYGEFQTTQSEIWPNAKHYSSVLKAHAKTKSPGGAKKALALLSEMERRFFDANIIMDGADSNHDSTDYHVDQKDVAKADIVCYSIVIDAFANSRLLEAESVAHRLLRAVETKYDAGDVSMKPNTRIYTAVILSLVHSPFIGDGESGNDSGKHANNAQRAWSILERMKKYDALPNSYTYNYIINCAAQSGHDAEDRKISFEIAIRAFNELRKTSSVEPDTNGRVVDPCHPDSFTFAFMLKACNNLLPSGSLRTKVMSQTFQECCRSGYLNDAVLDRLWRGVSTEMFYELIEEEPQTYSSGGRKNNNSPSQADKLPMSWSRCCKGGRRVNSDDTPWKKGVKLSIR
mmetsp:Transcript_24513/g.43993  ORF Transcript_24513/g.43993 Transcript_24513/m.43993 type:complete len:1175 (-) Transcript_24513:18-3542(-)